MPKLSDKLAPQGKRPRAKRPRPEGEPSYKPEYGSLNFAVVMALFKLGAVPSQRGKCSRADLMDAVKELRSKWKGMKDPPLAVEQDPEQMMQLPRKNFMPVMETYLKKVEYSLRRNKTGSIIEAKCKNPNLRMTAEGEATARYLLKKYRDEYNAPMPGFEDLDVGGEEAKGEEEDDGDNRGDRKKMVINEEVPPRVSKHTRQPSKHVKRRAMRVMQPSAAAAGAAAAAAAAAGRGEEDVVEVEDSEEEEEEEEELLTPTKAAPAKRSRPL